MECSIKRPVVEEQAGLPVEVVEQLPQEEQAVDVNSSGLVFEISVSLKTTSRGVRAATKRSCR